MSAASVLLCALVAGAGAVLGGWARGYHGRRRAGTLSTECAEQPPGTITADEWRADRRAQARYSGYVDSPFRRGPGRPPPQGECQGADFTGLMAVLAAGIEDHIRRDQLGPVAAAVFRARGGHAPGAVCPSDPAPALQHAAGCASNYDEGAECDCRPVNPEDCQ